MISYYELLGMIKEDKAPEKIRVHLTTNTSRIYVRENDFEGTFSFYGLLSNQIQDDEYKYYLAECLLESSMFDKNIEIIEDKLNIVKEKLEDRIAKAIDFLETQHNTYPSGEKWREALKDILKGGFIIEEEKDNRLHWKQKESLNGNFDKEEKIQILARRTEKLKKCLNDLIDKLEDK